MRTVKAALRDSAGMTVVEVIIALGVVTVGLIALIAAMPLSTILIGESNLKTTATLLAQQRMEQIKNSQWNVTQGADCLGVSANVNSAPVTASWTNCPAPAPAGLVTYPDEALGTIANYPQFQRQVRIQDCSVGPLCIAGVNPPTLLATLRQVTVTVSFARMTGVGTFDNSALDSVQLVTLIAKR